jgi:cytochrome c oxidase assembly factor CtaG
MTGGGGELAPNLLTHLADGPFVDTVELVTLGAVIFYLTGVRRLTAGGHHWPFWRTGAFIAGAFGTWVSVGSGLAVYSMTNLTLHVVRHIILMMTVPALFSLGRPLLLLGETGGPSATGILQATARSRLIGVLAHPVPVWIAYLGSMFLMLTDRPFFAYMMSHPVVGDASTVTMVAIGLLYWGTLVASSDAGRGVSYPSRVISILANMPFEVLAGIWLRYQLRPMDAMGSLADTRAAGEAFIVGATLVSTLWLVAVVVQWLSAAVREEGARLRAPGEDSDWTVPWWVGNAPER